MNSVAEIIEMLRLKATYPGCQVPETLYSEAADKLEELANEADR